MNGDDIRGQKGPGMGTLGSLGLDLISYRYSHSLRRLESLMYWYSYLNLEDVKEHSPVPWPMASSLVALFATLLSRFQWVFTNKYSVVRASILLYWTRGYSLPGQCIRLLAMDYRPGFARNSSASSSIPTHRGHNVKCAFSFHREVSYPPGWPEGLWLDAINKRVGLCTGKFPNEKYRSYAAKKGTYKN